MNINLLDINEDDIVMIHHCIGNLPPEEVDKYADKLLDKLTHIFGEGRIAFFVVREGPTWDFTVIRKPKVEKKSKKR